jgi:hypothetical protein
VTGIKNETKREYLLKEKKITLFNSQLQQRMPVGRGVFQTLLVLCGDLFARELLYSVFGTIVC